MKATIAWVAVVLSATATANVYNEEADDYQEAGWVGEVIKEYPSIMPYVDEMPSPAPVDSSVGPTSPLDVEVGADFWKGEDDKDLPAESGKPVMRPSSSPLIDNRRQPTLPPAALTDEPIFTPPPAAASDVPSMAPSDLPSSQPSSIPSADSTVGLDFWKGNIETGDEGRASPTITPGKSDFPSMVPSDLPSTQPSTIPTSVPSEESSIGLDFWKGNYGGADNEGRAPPGSDFPSLAPSDLPSTQPSLVPSLTE